MRLQVAGFVRDQPPSINSRWCQAAKRLLSADPFEAYVASVPDGTLYCYDDRLFTALLDAGLAATFMPLPPGDPFDTLMAAWGLEGE